MPIIFGWGRQTRKHYGPTFKNKCSHCHNEEYWELTRTITWFTLFFIPVIPYKITYFLMCPICTYGVNLHGKELDNIKALAEANTALIKGQITQEEYSRRLNIATPVESQDQIVDEPAEPKQLPDTNIKFCSECGSQLTDGAKFCIQCGQKVLALNN